MLLALAGLKGGVGKTTAAISIAAECMARGRRVLLVDLDPIGTLRIWSERAIESDHPSPTTLTLGRHVVSPERLRELGEGYDLAILDCPPGDAGALHTALMAADLAVFPCTPRPLDVWTLGPSLDIIDRVRQLRPELETPVMINRRDDRTVAAMEVRMGLAGHGLTLLDAMLGSRIAYARSMAMGLGVTAYDPDGAAAAEVRALVDELTRSTLAPTLAPHAMH